MKLLTKMRYRLKAVSADRFLHPCVSWRSGFPARQRHGAWVPEAAQGPWPGRSESRSLKGAQVPLLTLPTAPLGTVGNSVRATWRTGPREQAGGREGEQGVTREGRL